jgi:hypothetical protein
MASDVIKWELFATLYRLEIIKTKLHLHALGIEVILDSGAWVCIFKCVESEKNFANAANA